VFFGLPIYTSFDRFQILFKKYGSKNSKPELSGILSEDDLRGEDQKRCRLRLGKISCLKFVVVTLNSQSET
jgi:hypothetical protein